jgi:hypothetical protein
MVSEEFIKQKIEEANEAGRTKTFAEFIASMFVGRFVEIYLSDSYEEVSVEQISTNYPAVFCGKVVGAYRECLVINAAYVDKSRKLQLGNMMFLSERAIKALNMVDGNGTLEEMFLRSKESLDIKAAFIDHVPQK